MGGRSIIFFKVDTSLQICKAASFKANLQDRKSVV